MSGPGPRRVLPVVDDRDTGGLFEAAREGRLVVRFCQSCDRPLHLPRAYCYHCGSWDTGWREVGGLGTLYAWTVVEHGVHPAWEVPYTVVLVDVDGAPGVRLVGNLPGRPALRVGQAMEVWFDEMGEGVVIPNWVPVEH